MFRFIQVLSWQRVAHLNLRLSHVDVECKPATAVWVLFCQKSAKLANNSQVHSVPCTNVFQGILSRSSTLLHTLTWSVYVCLTPCLFSQRFAWNFNKSNFSHLPANPSSFHAASWRETMAQPWQTGACQWEASQRAVPLTKAPGTKNSEQREQRCMHSSNVFGWNSWIHLLWPGIQLIMFQFHTSIIIHLDWQPNVYGQYMWICMLSFSAKAASSWHDLFEICC